MLLNITLKWWQFWGEGEELSIKTGRALLALPALGGLVSSLMIRWLAPSATGHDTDAATKGPRVTRNPASLTK